MSTPFIFVNFILVLIISSLWLTLRKQLDCRSRLLSIQSYVLNQIAVILILFSFFGNLIMLLLTDSMSSNQLNFPYFSYFWFADTGSRGLASAFLFQQISLMVTDSANAGGIIYSFVILGWMVEENARLPISSVKLLSSLSTCVSRASLIFLSISFIRFKQSSRPTDVWDRSSIISISQHSQLISQLLSFP